MWEWRIFYPENEVPSWVSIIERKLINVPTENRFDLYVNLHKSIYGLKIRSYLGNSQLLELKILKAEEDNFELWEKRIKTPIKNDGADEILKTLRKYPVSEAILPILSTKGIEFVRLEKIRKKAFVDPVTIEKVIVKDNNKIWESIEIESHSINALEYFLRNILGVTRINTNTSYPEFLIQHF